MVNCWFYGREELTYHYPTAHVRQKAYDFYVVVKIKDVTYWDRCSALLFIVTHEIIKSQIYSNRCYESFACNEQFIKKEKRETEEKKPKASQTNKPRLKLVRQ